MSEYPWSCCGEVRRCDREFGRTMPKVKNSTPLFDPIFLAFLIHLIGFVSSQRQHGSGQCGSRHVSKEVPQVVVKEKARDEVTCLGIPSDSWAQRIANFPTLEPACLEFTQKLRPSIPKDMVLSHEDECWPPVIAEFAYKQLDRLFDSRSTNSLLSRQNIGQFRSQHDIKYLRPLAFHTLFSQILLLCRRILRSTHQDGGAFL